MSICCRIIYFANILYLGGGISKRNRAFSGFSLCEYLVGIWVNYNFVSATCNVLSHSSKDKVTTEITLASLSLTICNLQPNGTCLRIKRILIHSKKKLMVFRIRISRGITKQNISCFEIKHTASRTGLSN